MTQGHAQNDEKGVYRVTQGHAQDDNDTWVKQWVDWN